MVPENRFSTFSLASKICSSNPSSAWCSSALGKQWASYLSPAAHPPELLHLLTDVRCCWPHAQKKSSQLPRFSVHYRPKRWIISELGSHSCQTWIGQSATDMCRRCFTGRLLCQMLRVLTQWKVLTLNYNSKLVWEAGHDTSAHHSTFPRLTMFSISLAAHTMCYKTMELQRRKNHWSISPSVHHHRTYIKKDTQVFGTWVIVLNIGGLYNTARTIGQSQKTSTPQYCTHQTAP